MSNVFGEVQHGWGGTASDTLLTTFGFDEEFRRVRRCLRFSAPNIVGFGLGTNAMLSAFRDASNEAGANIALFAGNVVLQELVERSVRSDGHSRFRWCGALVGGTLRHCGIAASIGIFLRGLRVDGLRRVGGSFWG